MKKHMLLISNMIIVLAVVAGFTISVFKDTKSYQQLSEKHLQDVVSLADTDISNRIDSSMSKPVMVSKTMANDEFLKTWLSKEPDNTGNQEYLKQLYNYLSAYQLKYDYSTVFCISDQTSNYYYQNGINKKLSKNDFHDIWYYNFTSSGHEYDLEVDTNQANDNNIAVFVNFRVVGENGKLLGVIGVGLQASFIEDMIRSYEDNYNLSVYIINEGGAVNSFKGSTDIFVNQEKLAEYTGVNDEIEMNHSGDSKIQWFTSHGERTCLITKYDDTLGWDLILEMKTNSIISSFQKRLLSNTLFMLSSLAACIIVSTVVFINYNKRIISAENMDDLTGLPNRKLFIKQYQSFLRKHRDKPKILFMLDIDHFKEINDTHGHIFGNAVLETVADQLRKAIGNDGFAARWGGDEFIGVLLVGSEDAQKLLHQLADILKSEKIDSDYRVTVSVGLIEITGDMDMDEIIKEADKRLYHSKENGRDQISFC